MRRRASTRIATVCHTGSTSIISPEPRILKPGQRRPSARSVGRSSASSDRSTSASIESSSGSSLGPIRSGRSSSSAPILRDLDVGPLRALQNVHFLGPASLDRLPEFLKPMDVCTVPFLVNEHTRTMNPLKVLEYLAAGKPVVATPLPALRAYGPHVALASGPEEFAAAVEQALAEDSEARRRSRAEFAGRQLLGIPPRRDLRPRRDDCGFEGPATTDQRDARRGGNRVPITTARSERPVRGPT